MLGPQRQRDCIVVIGGRDTKRDAMPTVAMLDDNNRSVGWQACTQMLEARVSPAAAVVFDVPSDEDTVAGICTPPLKYTHQ